MKHQNEVGNEEQILKATEAVKVCAVSRRTFERMKDLGQIPYIRMGGGRVIRYRKSDLLKAMARMTVRG